MGMLVCVCGGGGGGGARWWGQIGVVYMICFFF